MTPEEHTYIAKTFAKEAAMWHTAFMRTGGKGLVAEIAQERARAAHHQAEQHLFAARALKRARSAARERLGG